MRSAIFLFMLMFGHSLMANKCRPYEPELRDQLQDILTKLENDEEIQTSDGRRIKPQTVDDFLSVLPPELRTDPIFMSSSKSIQGGTVESPRVLLKSPNSEIVISFSTDPSFSGGSNIEIIEFDAENAEFKLYEVEFPKESDYVDSEAYSGNPHDFHNTETLRNSDERNAVVNRNPDKCLQCHRTPIRPVWQPYRFWTGQTPFVEDTLVRDSKETEWFLKYMENIDTDKPRWRHITPPFTKRDIERGLSRNGQFTLPNQRSEARVFSPNDGSSNDLSNQFLDKNACMVANNLKDREDWDTIKYALAGILSGCQGADEFLPPAFKERADHFMESRNIAVVDGEFNFGALVQDTERRLNTSTTNKLESHRWFLEKHMTSNEAQREIDMRRGIGFGYRNFETSGREIAGLRYALQPFGVKVDEWSMDNDPMSFGHGQIFSNYLNQPIIQEVLRETRRCDDLKALSREALQKRDDHDAVAAEIESLRLANEKAGCHEKDSSESVETLNELSRDLLRNRFSELIENAGCAYCHDPEFSDGNNVKTNNVPDISFYNLENFEPEMKRRPYLMDVILDRISRGEDEAGHMPPFEFSFEESELNEIKAYFDTIREN